MPVPGEAGFPGGAVKMTEGLACTWQVPSEASGSHLGGAVHWAAKEGLPPDAPPSPGCRQEGGLGRGGWGAEPKRLTPGGRGHLGKGQLCPFRLQALGRASL